MACLQGSLGMKRKCGCLFAWHRQPLAPNCSRRCQRSLLLKHLVTHILQFYSSVYGTSGYDQTAANAAFHSVPYQEPGAAVWPLLWFKFAPHKIADSAQYVATIHNSRVNGTTKTAA